MVPKLKIPKCAECFSSVKPVCFQDPNQSQQRWPYPHIADGAPWSLWCKKMLFSQGVAGGANFQLQVIFSASTGWTIPDTNWTPIISSIAPHHYHLHCPNQPPHPQCTSQYFSSWTCYTLGPLGKENLVFSYLKLLFYLPKWLPNDENQLSSPLVGKT